MSEALTVDASAIISDCGTWRYRLERDLGAAAGPVVAIFGVNPSTADAVVDDQTIRKDMGFGRRLGWKRIIKGNKFAFRAKDVNKLGTASDPVGPENDAHLERIMRDADLHIVAWGPLAKLPWRLRGRWARVVRIAAEVGCPLYSFGIVGDGMPRHTCMIGYDTVLVPWRVPL